MSFVEKFIGKCGCVSDLWLCVGGMGGADA